MKNHAIVVMLLLALTVLGCGKKDADKAAGDKPATTGAPVAAKPTTATKPAVELPAECKEFTAAFETLMKCDKLKDQADQMKTGYEKMLKAMTDLGDVKAMVDGCTTGMSSLKDALKIAGC